MSNWNETLANLKKAAGVLGRANPPMVKAFLALNQSLDQRSALNRKTRELIALALFGAQVLAGAPKNINEQFN